MENNYYTQQSIPLIKSALPNSTAVLVMGIISIVFCNFVGLILGIIAIVLAKKDMETYNSNPEAYTLDSLNNIKTGKICAIIGTILSAILMIFVLIYILVIFGLVGFSLFSYIN